MDDLLEVLGRKEPGELILAGDGGWNQLVGEIAKMRDELRGEIGQLATQVGQLRTQLGETTGRLAGLERTAEQIRTDFESLRSQIEPLFYRVTLTAPKERFAVGELAEITALVSDLRGRAVTDRPWVDFITSWGQFRPHDAFAADSRGGVGNRTLSVRTDAQGLARALIGADVLDGLPEDAQKGMENFLSKARVADAVITAETALDAKPAFDRVTEVYEQERSSVQIFADEYFRRNAPTVSTLKPWDPEQWRDYRATVLALAKADTDPTTADQNRGSASLQLSFREWVVPWLRLSYLSKERTAELAKTVEIDPANLAKADVLKTQIQTVAPATGMIGRMLGFEAVQQAVEKASATEAQKEQAIDTLSLQRTVEAQQLAILSHMPRMWG
jgi:hypothetical protein